MCSRPKIEGAMEAMILLCTNGSLDSSIIFASSSGVGGDVSGSLPKTSMELASSCSMNVLSFPMPIREGAKARTMPTMETWSPGLAMSTISSPISFTANTRGSCPGGRSSGFSWSLRSCESMNVDSS